MKTISLLFAAVICAFQVKAQELAPNQNPNYKVSQAKYEAQQTKLSSSMNTTVQSTYKAYDWTEAKEAKKNQRIARRQERALARINNRPYFSYPDYLFMTPHFFYYRH